MEEYFKLLEENEKIFKEALNIAKNIAVKARELFEDCEVYIVGSFARKEYTLSSDLDILIVSNTIPEKIDFEWYYRIVKNLVDDYRINIHLLNKEKFRKLRKSYSPMIKVDIGEPIST